MRSEDHGNFDLTIEVPEGVVASLVRSITIPGGGPATGGTAYCTFTINPALTITEVHFVRPDTLWVVLDPSASDARITQIYLPARGTVAVPESMQRFPLGGAITV